MQGELVLLLLPGETDQVQAHEKDEKAVQVPSEQLDGVHVAMDDGQDKGSDSGQHADDGDDTAGDLTAVRQQEDFLLRLHGT